MASGCLFWLRARRRRRGLRAARTRRAQTGLRSRLTSPRGLGREAPRGNALGSAAERGRPQGGRHLAEGASGQEGGAHGRGGGCTEEGRAAKEWGAPRRRAHGRGWGGARRRDAHDRGAGRYGVDPELRGPAALDACGRGGEEGVVRPWDAPVRRRAGERAKELPGSGRSDPSWEARWFLSGPGGTPVLFCKMGLAQDRPHRL